MWVRMMNKHKFKKNHENTYLKTTNNQIKMLHLLLSHVKVALNPFQP